MGRQRFRAAVRYHAVSAPMPPIRVAILGGGPAGLSAGKVLTDHGVALTLFEKNAEVGGMARTIRHGPYRFDLGGHRFYTKNRAVRAFLDELFPDDLLTVARSSKIFFQGRYFDYPLKPMNAFFGMGPWTSVEILFDYLRQKLRPRPPRSRNFEEWVVHAFGRKMFECYFKCYTEKVWGIDCSRISADWASQRIGGLSLRVALLNALGLKRNNTPKTLIESFRYPRYGIGEISLRMGARIEAENRIFRRARVRTLLHDGSRIMAVLWEDEKGEIRCHEATHYLSSIPITEVVRGLDPPAPPEILAAAERLRFRSLVVVALFFDCPQVTETSWIYFPDPQIGFGRIHEPNNWSRDLVPEGRSCLVFEYFCTAGDEVWSLDDAALVERTLADLSRLDLHPRLPERVIDRCVVRLRNAYPIYEIGFKEPLGRIMRYIRNFSNLTLMGRYGTYKYINMDHSIEMGMKAAENLLGRRHDLLGVDADPAYLEGPPLDSAA